MTSGRFQASLMDKETLLWEGRPAPRCYTFRHWLQAAVGTVLFLASSFWLMVGVQLIRVQSYSLWLISIPVLLVSGSFFVGPGQLLIARWRWEKIFYAVTDCRLLVRNRLFGDRISIYELKDYRRCKRKKYGENLYSLHLSFLNNAPVVLECLEHPENLLEHLPAQNSDAQREVSV